MQSLSSTNEALSTVSTARRGVLVEDDGSFLSRRLVSIADMIAWRCGWPLSIVAAKSSEAPRHMRTPRDRYQVIDPTKRPASARPQRRGDVLVVSIPKGWEASPLEATASRSVAHASCSVWLARDDLAKRQPARAPQRILVGVGDTQGSSRVLELAAKLAASFAAELTVAHVVAERASIPSDPPALEDCDFEQAIGAAHGRLGALCRQMRQITREPHFTLPVGEAAETLISLSSGFDLVVVGRGNGAKSAWEPGSVAARVAGDAACSVLVVN